MKTLSLILFGVLIASGQAWASCLDATRLTGVNMAGAEFNSSVIPGVIEKNYIYPKNAELAFVADQKANVIRLPIRWERIQPTIKGPLVADELQRIKDAIELAKTNGLCVLVDIHNYAKFFADPLAGNAALQDGFVDLWLRLAAEFKNADATTAFDLMNEPNYMPVIEWSTLAKRTLAALRQAGSKNMVFVSGGRWSGVHDWFALQNDVSNATAFADLKDPLNRTVIEVHQYFDDYYAGTTTVCRPPADFDLMFQKINDWAKTNKQKLFLGEFGSPQTQECLATLDKILSLTQDATVWKGFTYWAAGRWWGNYPMALNMTNVEISPQWAVLKKYFQQQTLKKSAPNPPTLKRS